MCKRTSNVFETMAAENLGYAVGAYGCTSLLQETIARGYPNCRIVIYLKQTPQAKAWEGREYFKS